MTTDAFDFRRLSELERVEALKNTLVASATGEGGDDLLFREVRAELMREARLRDLAPAFVRTCRSLGEFWSFIKPRYAKYAERREYLKQEFHPLLTHLEGFDRPPIADSAIVLQAMTEDGVHEAWRRMLDRRATDPEGAITSARSLVETVCKHILDDLGEPYEDGADLPVLYKLTAKRLNLAPSAHTEQVFKQILSGCQSIVEGLGALRNKHGDAHGKGPRAVKPSARHADLAVHVGGAMAVFLIATWKHGTTRGR